MGVAWESKAAWADVKNKVSATELAVLDLIEDSKLALCDAEIEHALGHCQYQPKARRNALARAGLIKFSHTGPSPYTGRPVKFWTRLNLQEKADRASNGKINTATIRKHYDPKNKKQRTMFALGGG